LEMSTSPIENENEEVLTFLPPHLRQSAVFLGRELAWRTEDALRVIGCLALRSWAVVGVQLMDQVEGAPLWIMSSDYRVDKGLGREAYVVSCAENAKLFIQEFSVTSESLFLLVWNQP